MVVAYSTERHLIIPHFMSVYIIAGYGVPTTEKDELKYKVYFSEILAYIQNDTVDVVDSTIIFCGGNTDLVPPYTRTEAAEMKRRFVALAEQQGITPNTGKYILEDHSLSTLENVLYSHAILQERDLLSESIVIFCEDSRATRVQRFVDAIFTGSPSVTVHGVDFYSKLPDSENIDRKHGNEKIATDVGLWALESPENLKKMRGFFESKFAFFRAFEGTREDALKQWLQVEGKEVLESLEIPFELS